MLASEYNDYHHKLYVYLLNKHNIDIKIIFDDNFKEININ